MTFKPRFEDFESVTKTIGDGSQVNQLLVHVYEEGVDQPEEKIYNITNCQVQEEVKIPFYYGKKYKVYFWAYKSGNDSPYTVSNIGLKGGVSVEYPDGALDFDALESLDAFYAVSDVDLSNGRTMDINLTRPFAQVNLVANMADLATAQASKVEFTINVAKTFNLASQKVEGTTEEQTFTFTSTDYFQNTEEINGNVYLGTTYIFVPSSGKVTGKVKLYAGDNVLKSAENIEIPLVGNKRTNLVFSGFEVTVPDWDSSKETVPGDSDGWIIITEPEQLAALLMTGTTENTQVRIGSTLNMEKMPAGVKSNIAGKSFNGLTLDGNGLTIKNYEAPAFFATATNLNVSNLTLENVKISAATHVGVLVNELHGNGTFTNVTVKDSYAVTTNGAAGGVVGYIRRTTETNRAESLDVLFEGCKIIGSNVYNIAVGTQAEGKFVGLFSGYDNGEKLLFTNCTSENANVADYTSRYVEGNEGAWLADNDYSAYNGFLGDETYLRGQVYFVGEDKFTIRFCPKWDGTTTVEPLIESNIKQIYSAFDIAKLQKSSHSAVTFKANVDLGGYKFNPIKSITNLDGENHTIYNLKVDMVHDGTGAAFIQSTSGTTVHKDITFIGADIKNVHNPNIPAPEYGNINDGGAGNAYAGTLVSHSGGNYTVSNVQVKNGKVYAVCKMGGLVGYVGSSNFTMENCSVDNCVIENYEPNIPNYYTLPRVYELDLSSLKSLSWITSLFGIGKIPSTAIVNCLQWWYTNGECGGLIGFIKSPSAVIDKCSVTNTKINCTGQPNKAVVANVWDKDDFDSTQPYRSNIKIFAKGNTDIAGRHINQFIGDVVSERKEGGSNYNITISDYVVSGNTYYDLDASSSNNYNHNYAVNEYCEVVGCAYYVGVDVKLFDVDLTHVNDCAGSLTFNSLNGSSVTVTEDLKNGNNISWVGGSFTDAEYAQKKSGPFYNRIWSYDVNSFYPTYP